MTDKVPPGTRFTALADFESEELQSVYCKDLSYTVRAGDDTLAALVPLWLRKGKVKLDSENKLAAMAQASGGGEVS